jgi:hypothetical protein
MNNIKCPKCGLVNFSTTAYCKRCNEDLQKRGSYSSANSPPRQPFVNHDSVIAEDFTNENRKIGFLFLVFGIVSSIALG